MTDLENCGESKVPGARVAFSGVKLELIDDDDIENFDEETAPAVDEVEMPRLGNMDEDEGGDDSSVRRRKDGDDKSEASNEVEKQEIDNKQQEQIGMQSLSPRNGVSFQQEYSRLPDFSPDKRTSPIPSGYELKEGVVTPVLKMLGGEEQMEQTAPFINVSLNEFVGKDVPILIGTVPKDDNESSKFLDQVRKLNVQAVITVNIGTSVSNRLPWPQETGKETVFSRNISAASLTSEQFRDFSITEIRIQDLITAANHDFVAWAFYGWPTSKVVPSMPHFFLDFLRTLIQQTYFNCRVGQPILIIDNCDLDVAALTSAIVMLLYQACQQRRADVWRCVADLRWACRRNVVSRFEMYEFVYDCLLQIMSATPTIMSGNFRRSFRHLLKRGPSMMSTESPRRVAPIIEQFELIWSMSQMYRSRVVLTKTNQFKTLSPESKRSNFEPRHYKGISYFNMPSFQYSKHFIAVRGVVHINCLMELMAKRCSRTLLWFSETPRADEILTGNQHDGVFLSEPQAYGVFYSFELEAPTARGPWRVTVVQFVGWPAFSGERPARPCKELVLTIRRVLEHAEAVAASKNATQVPGDDPIKPVVTLYEADTGCCTWRGAMVALAASLDQRMRRFHEVDIFRTCQIFKIFDPESIVISPVLCYIVKTKFIYDIILLL